jgi:hypothetical protein
MIAWPTILFGAALSAAFALGAAFLIGRERDPRTLALVLITALAGPIAWNAVLHSRGSAGFFVDAPVIVFPVSWQDVGSGVWTLAAASLLFGVTQDRARRALVLSLLTAAAAFLVDIYLY